MSDKYKTCLLVSIFIMAITVLSCGGCLVIGISLAPTPKELAEIEHNNVKPKDRPILKAQPEPTKAPDPLPEIASDELQQQRLELINKLIAENIILKIEIPGTIPNCYVLESFGALNIDDKQTFMSVCFAWAYKIPKDKPPKIHQSMRIVDGRTGKEIGKFSATGLKMY